MKGEAVWGGAKERLEKKMALKNAQPNVFSYFLNESLGTRHVTVSDGSLFQV